MNKTLVIALIAVFVGAGIFLYLRSSDKVEEDQKIGRIEFSEWTASRTTKAFLKALEYQIALKMGEMARGGCISQMPGKTTQDLYFEAVGGIDGLSVAQNPEGLLITHGLLDEEEQKDGEE